MSCYLDSAAGLVIVQQVNHAEPLTPHTRIQGTPHELSALRRSRTHAQTRLKQKVEHSTAREGFDREDAGKKARKNSRQNKTARQRT